MAENQARKHQIKKADMKKYMVVEKYKPGCLTSGLRVGMIWNRWYVYVAVLVIGSFVIDPVIHQETICR